VGGGFGESGVVGCSAGSMRPITDWGELCGRLGVLGESGVVGRPSGSLPPTTELGMGWVVEMVVFFAGWGRVGGGEDVV
jgi:hypothetical protein